MRAREGRQTRTRCLPAETPRTVRGPEELGRGKVGRRSPPSHARSSGQTLNGGKMTRETEPVDERGGVVVRVQAVKSGVSAASEV